MLGARPTYTTPTGVLGDGLDADGNRVSSSQPKTVSLTINTQAAVSKAYLTSAITKTCEYYSDCNDLATQDALSESKSAILVADASDYKEALKSGESVYATIGGRRTALSLSLTKRQREILLAGGLLPYTKKKG